jgi:hypothetical protein
MSEGGNGRAEDVGRGVLEEDLGQVVPEGLVGLSVTE